MNKSGEYLVWTVFSVMGVFAPGYIALNRGEQIDALQIVAASICIYLIAYRFCRLYIAKNVLAADPTRITPAVHHNDGLDYVPTDEKVLFGHHFAVIAGTGPLVRPALAAQMGYLPGMIRLLARMVLAGAVQDSMMLSVSMCRDGRSLGELVKEEIGPIAGMIALVACFTIMVIILAVLAMIVAKALIHSPWGTYTVAFTIPLALFMGIYLRYLCPRRIGEVPVVGLVSLIFAIISGGWVAESPTWVPYFDFTGMQLTWVLVDCGLAAAVPPVWLLLAPRDYLSTFLKVGTIVGLAAGILIVRPTLTMPALAKSVDGTGPVWAGSLFSFLFITIACGAMSGFHALISSGTTPKTLTNEGQAYFIGYGGMLMESFVAIMALVSACIIDPGVYFVMNSPMAVLAPAGAADVVISTVQVASSWGFSITSDTLNQITSKVDEQLIISRAGGAPMLAVGTAYTLHGTLGGMMDVMFWYHFVILFEVLSILTTVDVGTRVARFMLQDLPDVVSPGLKRTDSLSANLLVAALCVLAWGYFLHQGVANPLGGISTLWPLFDTVSQMLAGMALMFCATVLFKMKRQCYAWVALVPTARLLICTLTTGWQRAFSPGVKVDLLVIANKFQAMTDSGNIPPQYIEPQLAQLVFNDRLDAGLAAFFMVVVVVLALFSTKATLVALKGPKPTAKETPYGPMPEDVEGIVAQAKGVHQSQNEGGMSANVGLVPGVPSHPNPLPGGARGLTERVDSICRSGKAFMPHPALLQ